MKKFDFLFGIEFGRKLLNMLDNLSRSLQAKTLSACEGQKLVNVTLVTLQSIRSEMKFDLFWQYVESRRSVVKVSPPELPRRRKVPRRYEVGETPPEIQPQLWRRLYFEGIDLVIAAIKNRFDQQGFRILQNLEVALLEKRDVERSEVVNEVVQFYGDDFNHKKHNLFNFILGVKKLWMMWAITEYLQSLSTTEKDYYCEVIKLVKLILVMPATNTTSERSFSALRRLKTWLQSTTCQARLNWSMILHVHKDRTDKLPMSSVANEFSSRNDSRLHMFGQFN